jgi:hypothetical protein
LGVIRFRLLEPCHHAEAAAGSGTAVREEALIIGVDGRNADLRRSNTSGLKAQDTGLRKINVRPR